MDFQKLLEYVRSLDLTETDSDTIRLTTAADEAIAGLLEAEATIKEAKDKLKDRYLAIAAKNPKLKSYEGDRVRVGYTMRRSKTISGDPEAKFVVIEKKPNTKAIDTYREATGKLPDGIGESVAEFIQFKLVKSQEEDE